MQLVRCAGYPKPARPTQTVVEHTCRRRIRRAEHVLLRIGGQLPVLGFTLPERAVQYGIFRTEGIKGTAMRAWLSSMAAWEPPALRPRGGLATAFGPDDETAVIVN